LLVGMLFTFSEIAVGLLPIGGYAYSDHALFP
jgi:hypothetical protein